MHVLENLVYQQKRTLYLKEAFFQFVNIIGSSSTILLADILKTFREANVDIFLIVMIEKKQTYYNL